MFLYFNILCDFSMIHSMENLSLPSVPKDILKHHIVKPYLGFTAIARLKRVDKSNNICLGESFYSDCKECASCCGNFACREIARDCTWGNKALIHFAEKNNTQMFQHIWCSYSKKRDQDVRTLLECDLYYPIVLPWLTYMDVYRGNYSSPRLTYMDVYRGNYSSPQNLRIIRSRKLIEALRDQNIDHIKTIVELSKDFDFFVNDNRGEVTLLEYLSACIYWKIALQVLRFKTYTKHNMSYLGLAMHLALSYGNSALCCALLKCVPDINYRYGKKRQTILHRAIIMSYSGPFIHGIIQAQADVNLLDIKGHAPFYYAQKIKDKQLRDSIELLLKIAGAVVHREKKKWKCVRK